MNTALLALLLLASAAGEPARVLRFQVTGEDAGPLTAVHWRAGARTPLPADVQRGADGAIVTVQAPCVRDSVVVIESPAHVGRAVLDGQCDGAVPIALASRATVTGQVGVARGVTSPRHGVLRCMRGDLPLELPFAISESRFDAAAFAACDGLTLAAAGFAPVRLPQPLKPGERRDLGSLSLVEGASVAVRVRSAPDREAQPGVRVTAVRAHELSAQRHDLQLEKIAIGSAVTDAQGWARISGIPEERVHFVIQAPGRSYPAVTEPYTFERGEETVVDDVLVEAPSTVFVTVALPDGLNEAVQLREVELTPAGESYWPRGVPLRAVLANGTAEARDVPPGAWKVSAAGRLKNGFALRLAERKIDVFPGVDANVTLTVTDTLFHGRVTHRGEPVAGVINLNPAEPGAARSAVAYLGADGTFQVLLEKKGDYTAFIQRKTTRSGIRLHEPIAFTNPDGEVEIELPPGRISGRVAGAAGTPAAAGVSAKRSDEEAGAEVGARVREDGTFVLDYVSPGTWQLVAEAPDAESEPLPVPVAAGDVEGVTLMLEPVRTIAVRVVDQTGTPVKDVLVDMGKPILQRTDGEGNARFRLKPAQQETPLNLVFIDVRTRAVSCAVRKLDADQTVVLEARYGEVHLSRERRELTPGTSGRLLSPSGCSVPVMGARIRVPAGTWSYVETAGDSQAMTRVETFTVEADRTASVILPPR